MRRAARRIEWRWIDLAVAAALAIDLVLESLLAAGVPDAHRVVTAVCAVPFAATIAVRRRVPGGALIACCALVLFQQLLHGQLVTTLPSQSACLAPILCAYGAGAWLTARRGLASAAIAASLLYTVELVATYAQHVRGAGGFSGGLGIVIFFIVAPFAVGGFVRVRNRRAKAFAELECQTLAERAERERAAIAEERVLIGRELQDIIAHSVSVMVVQASGARRLLTAQPDRARESILTVEQTGREALAEMRRLLGVLRREDDPRALAPQPGLDQLPELAELMHARGLECEIARDGLPSLTPGIDLVAYRVIEAALAGAAEQGSARALVTLSSRARALDLEVRAADAAAVAERLRSVAERVELYDGHIEVGGDGELVVRCSLPLGAAVAG